MEITPADLRIGDYDSETFSESFQDDEYEIQASEDNAADVRCALGVRRAVAAEFAVGDGNPSYFASPDVEPNLNSIQHSASTVADSSNEDSKPESTYQDSLDSESLSEEIRRGLSEAAEAFVRHEDQLESYEISTVVIPSDILEELSFSLKREKSEFESKWLRREAKDLGKAALIRKVERGRRENSAEDTHCSLTSGERSKRSRRRRRLGGSRQEQRERLRKKAECMREKRKKLYEEESEEQRLERLAREAAKRREMRMYYETPEQRRKRLDAEAARKREYRMYNETPDERRKRLDREAERRRVKRLTMYASETPEQRRERLNRESAKRREARLTQYAKETEEQRQERLRKDALRAREMRFTRSAIETDEERRQRLVKDAVRKRELRMHGESTTSTVVGRFTELQTVRNFEELNNVQMKDDPDNQLGGHYLSNWMMWFQNTLTQPASAGDKSNGESQQQSH